MMTPSNSNVLNAQVLNSRPITPDGNEKTPAAPQSDSQIRSQTASARDTASDGAAASSLALGDKVTLSSQAVDMASEEVSSVPSEQKVEPKPNRYAENILGFIGGQIAVDIADGANDEALQSRFDAGLSGFLQGFDEAYAQLSSLPAFDSAVREDVLATKEGVLNGMSALAEKLGLDAAAIDEARAQLENERAQAQEQVAQPEAVSNAPSFERFDMLAAQENRFEFELTTADGDKVTILASTLEAIQATKDKQSESIAFGEKQAFAFTVEGELDAGELKAINFLLDSAANVSELFFEGNVEDAFEQALEMGFDSQEIMSYSLSLTQTKTAKISTYESNAPNTNQLSPSKNLSEVGAFLAELNVTQVIVEQLGISKNNTSVLLEAVATLQYSESRAQSLSQFIDENTL